MRRRELLSGPADTGVQRWCSIVGLSSRISISWRLGVVLGARAGVAVLMLPERLGLGTPPHIQSNRNMVAGYLTGGLAASTAANLMQKRAA